MTPVHRFELFLMLMAVVIVFDLIARRLRLPRAMALILGGIALALFPGTPDIEMDPELVLVLFLPPLLMSSAWFTSWRDFRADIRIILQLAVGAVIFTTIVVGVIAHWVMPALPWAACFALGAIVSPPDAVAAKAVLAKIPLPPRMILLLESESLVNDASGLVLFRLAVAAAATGVFSLGQATLSFAWLSIGGVITGVVFAFASIQVIKRMREPDLIILWTFVGAWLSYILAEKIGVSGVLSTVACGMVLGWYQHDILTAATRTRSVAVWTMVVFALESVVFILIGLSLRSVLSRLGGADGALAFAPAVFAIVAAVILSRFVWIFASVYSPRLLSGTKRRHRMPTPPAVPLIMSWAGLRGVVSLAAALSLPEEFAGRDFIIASTFAVILITVIVQGSTLASLVEFLSSRSGLRAGQSSTLSENEARARVAHAQLAAIEKASLNEDGTHKHPRLLEQYTYRASAAKRFNEESDSLMPHRADHYGAVLDAIVAGRLELLRMHRAGEIQDRVLHAIEEELDLEDVRIRRFVEP
jgi:CPA1 family monovalent cation:H+ antiporter